MARLAEGWTEPELERVPAGEFLGVLQWSAADGSVRRYVVRQGRRVNGIAVWPFVVGARLRGWEMGWDAFLSGLRRRLSMPKRRLPMGPDG